MTFPVQLRQETEWCPPSLLHNGKPWKLHELTVLECFSTGSSATVKKCTYNGNNPEVIVKTFFTSTSRKTDILRAQREIQVHKDLVHENIVKVYAVFEDGKTISMVQEYVGGGSVAQQVADAGGYLEEQQAAEWIIQPLLSALEFLHAKEIVHRDIKVSNLRYAKDGRLKLLDFGLAVNVNHAPASGCVGTLDHMAPEVVTCSAESHSGYGTAVDIWALGTLAYELLVGGPPFESATKEETLYAIVNDQPFIPSHLSSAAQDFLQQALCKDPSRRPGANTLAHHQWVKHHLASASL